MDQVLKSAPDSTSVTFYGDDDDTIVDPGVVTVTIDREDGTNLVTAGATTGTGAAPRTRALTSAETGLLDRLRLTWTSPTRGSKVTYVEVLGGLIFELADARAYRDKQLADTTLYPAVDVRRARELVGDLFQEACGVAFVPRYEREAFSGDGRSGRLQMRWNRVTALRKITVDGIALTAPELAEVTIKPWGVIRRDAAWPEGDANIVVTYEHGHLEPPFEIHRAALALAHYQLTASEVIDRMVAFANELGTVRLSVPGSAGAPTGLPLVDAALLRYDETSPV